MIRVKFLMIGAGLICALSSVGVAMADPPPDNFGGNGQAWVNDYGQHYVNVNNPNTRMDWDCHQFAVPGVGGAHANGKAAVVNHPDTIDGKGTLVVPIDKSSAC
jgi:hypothetical protein